MKPRSRHVAEVRSVPVLTSAFERQCRLLAEGDVTQRVLAAYHLRDYGAPALEPLCEALRDRDHRVRSFAAASLGALGDPRAVPALTEALRRAVPGRSGHWLRVGAVLSAVGSAMGYVLIAAMGRVGVVALVLLFAGLMILSAWGQTPASRAEIARIVERLRAAPETVPHPIPAAAPGVDERALPIPEGSAPIERALLPITIDDPQ